PSHLASQPPCKEVLAEGAVGLVCGASIEIAVMTAEESPTSIMPAPVQPASVHPALASAPAAPGCVQLTPVPPAMLEHGHADADLLVSAQTGSGKTVAFGIAIAATLLGDRQSFAAPGRPLGLVIAPTRELAMQVRNELDWLYADAEIRTATCVGGMD